MRVAGVDEPGPRQRVSLTTKAPPELSGAWRVSVLPDTQYSEGVAGAAIGA